MRYVLPGRMSPLLILCLFATASHAAPVAEKPLCPPIEGSESLTKPGKIILLGEIHGTAESPVFAADLSCLALTKGGGLTVALEISQKESARVDRYLASEGSPKDRADLLAGDFWHSSFQDGRSSKAMSDLLESLRRLRHSGQAVHVELFDPAEAPTPQDRDRGMAANLAAAIQRTPGDLFIVLTGNIHSRTVQGTPWDPKYEPMGLLLTKTYAERIVPLNVSSSGGTAWICLGPSDCKAREIKGGGEGTARKVILLDQRTPEGYAGKYYVGKLTASPPAADDKPEAPKPAGGR